ncbi:hypothetical protein CDG24_25230 [Salmonella enterica subsp. enterica serovar Newport]|nr:hypothetical protein [Salmonella enterica subsp. enterica serovar Newport]
MANLMLALRNAHEAGDTEAATRIAAMIKNQNAQEAAQAAPQQAQPQTNPTPPQAPQEAPQEPQSALERGFNAVGQVAASGGRMIAGGVADLANVGVGAVNAVQSAGAWAGQQMGLGDGTYTPLPQAGYGELDQYLQPRSTGEKIVAGAAPFILGGEVAAPIKAAENAGRITRAATSVINNAPGAIASALSENNQGDNAGDMAASIALNSVLPGVVEKVGGAAIKGARNLLPEALGGFSQAEKAAAVANPDYVANVLQGGNQEAQAAYRTATTDANGNSILNPSQTLNTQAGKKYIAAEQRDLNRGTASQYGQRLEQQKTGEGITQAVNDTLTPTTGDAGLLQQAAQDTTEAFKARAKQLYNENKASAQKILDDAPVKITNLKMPETKNIATAHLDDSAATGNIKLTPDARRTLTQFNKTEIKSIDDLDMWKRTLNEKAQKAYRGGDFSSYNALNEVSSSLKGEADTLLNNINPQAGSLYREADKFYSQSVGDFGDKSVLGKIAGKDNPDLAANALVRGQNAEYNTQQITAALQDAIARGDIPNAQALAAQLGQGVGEATRSEALRAATTGENFSAAKFTNTLSRLEPQAAAANTLGGGSQAEVNQALRDAIATIRNRATVPETNGLVAQAVGRGIGGAAGFATGGGAIGGMIGQEVGGRITSAVNQGLLDRLAGTVKRGNEYVNYLSNPENAKAVSDILASRGASLDTATAKEVKGIIDGLTKSTVNNVSLESQANAITPAQPTAQASSEPTAPAIEPEPQPAAPVEPKRGKAMRLYKSLASAETGGLDNRFIRTKAAEAGPSTAWGPAQITVTLADDFAKKHASIFTDEERDYLKRFSAQGHKMLKAKDNDPVYGYGGTGTLTSPEDQRLYARVAVKMLDQMIADNNGSLETTMKKWRGADDKAYFAKVRKAYKTHRSWGRPTTN